MSKMVVTGGAGFIGSHLVEELLGLGHEVKVLDNLAGSDKAVIPKKAKFVLANILDKRLMESEFMEQDFVFHLAALQSVPKSVKNPKECFEININGTLNLLEAAKKAKVKKVVFASSSSVYGSTGKFPQKESDCPNPVSPYAISKLSGENLCGMYTEVYGLPSISLRYFNVYGERQNPEAQYSAVIPKFIYSMLKGEKPVVFGNGSQARDFIYVKDVVDANIAAMKSKKTGAFNIGSGEAVTVKKLFDEISRILEFKKGPKYEKERAGDVQKTLASTAKMKKELKFSPKTPLKEGIKKTVEWFRERY